MKPTVEQIKELRELTGISIAECKKALEEAGGNAEKAKALLKEWGKEVAAKKQERATGEGLVVSYIHGTGKVVVFVGTKVQIKNFVHDTAVEANVPYVTERWIGGLLTNFEGVSKRIAHLKDLEKKLADEEEANKYTKWERHEMQEEIEKLNEKFGGMKTLEKLPDAIFVFDFDENQLAVKEAKQKGIQVFAICDTNCDPSLVDYAIPANDDAISSVRYILQKVKDAILKARGT